MNEPRFLGIDGGGSGLRIAVVDARLQALETLEFGAANPGVIGHAAARQHIRGGVDGALRQSGVDARQIAAAGIGIAGASNLHSSDWLRHTLAPVLPHSLLALSSDLEIALAGALGQRHGILLLSGTGSAVFGCAPDGRQLQIGGWGYLLGDEGSGYWIGRKILRQVTEEHDRGEHPSALAGACLDELGLNHARDIVGWLYGDSGTTATRVAALARIALDMAASGNADALNLLGCAANHLGRQTELMRRRLDYPHAPIAFAGGLLDKDNPLSLDVARRLDLERRPQAKHSPVIGAALLAILLWSDA